MNIPTLPNGKTIVAVALSGNTKLYHFLAVPADALNKGKGDRIVIPNKSKDDGSLSLSIATLDHVVANTDELKDVNIDTLKPIVQFIDNDRLREAQLAMVKLEAVHG